MKLRKSLNEFREKCGRKWIRISRETFGRISTNQSFVEFLQRNHFEEKIH